MDSLCRRSRFAECCFIWIYSKDVARKESYSVPVDEYSYVRSIYEWLMGVLTLD